MRRFLSTLLLCGATLIGVGVSTSPVIVTRMDSDLAYANGKTLYFKASEWDDGTNNGNYTDSAGEFLHYDETRSKQAISYIADTMRTRLDAYGITSYKVETQGSDTIAVTIRTPGDSAAEYSAIQSYLAFSGQDYELDASDVTLEGYAFDEHLTDIIDGQTAKIVDWEMNGFNVPTVVIPLKSGDDYKNAFTNLVDYCKKHTTKGDTEKGTEDQTTAIVVWANRLEGDTNETAEVDTNVAAKVFASVNPNDGVYYESGDTDQKTPFLRLIPRSAATSGEQYDPSKTQQAYDAARAMMLSFNASKFVYDELKVGTTVPQFHVTFAYSVTAPASVESLIVLGDWNPSVAMSATFISIGICLIFLIALLAIFERIMAVLELSVMAISVFSAFAVFVSFGAAFNVAALIGLTVGALISLFGPIYYSAKLKEEIYKGRTVKKAHAEAVKKALLPTLDVNLVAILIGVCVYALAGDVASKAGVMLVLCGFFGFIASILYTRVAGWMLCNDSTVAKNFPKLLGVKSDRIPDLIKDEKPTYFGPYADRDFRRGKKISLIATAAFLLAGLGATIGWGVATNGNSFFNSSSYEQSAPTLRIDVRSNSSTLIDTSAFADTASIWNKAYKEGAPNDIFHAYKVSDVYLADYFSNIVRCDSPLDLYYGQGAGGLRQYWWYYEAKFASSNSVLAKAIALDAKDIVVSRYNAVSGQFEAQPSINTVSALADDIIMRYAGGAITPLEYGASTERLIITFDPVVPNDLTPYLWQIALGVGVGLAAAMVYMVLRYRPSRGLAATLIAAGSSFVAVTFFALTRISTVPSVALAAIPVAVIALALSIFIFASEKDIARESKEKDKHLLEFHLNCLNTAISRQAGNVLVFSLLGFYAAIVFLAFGPRIYATAYIGEVLGIALALALALTATYSLSGVFMRLFSNVRLAAPKRKPKKKPVGQLMRKNVSAEPEESIVPGIND